MHPTILYELAQIKIADDLAEAERRRRARQAVSGRQRPIDWTGFATRLRGALTGSRSLPGAPSDAGA